MSLQNSIEPVDCSTTAYPATTAQRPLTASHKPELDLLRATAGDLQAMLNNGEVSCVQLVERYLDQIDRHNFKGARLYAVISTAARSEALSKAHLLDLEREVSLF